MEKNKLRELYIYLTSNDRAASEENCNTNFKQNLIKLQEELKGQFESFDPILGSKIQ